MSPESCVGTGGSLGGGDSPASASEVVKPLLASELGLWDTVAVSPSKFQQAQEGRSGRHRDLPDLRLNSHPRLLQKTPKALDCFSCSIQPLFQSRWMRGFVCRLKHPEGVDGCSVGSAPLALQHPEPWL